MMNLVRTSTTVLLLVSMAACGGGGGNDGAPEPPPPNPPASTYTLELTDISLDDTRFGANISVSGLPIDGATVTVQ